jgi:hypothetical protein
MYFFKKDTSGFSITEPKRLVQGWGKFYQKNSITIGNFARVPFAGLEIILSEKQYKNR